jgi:hypothetical protein
VEKAGEIWAWNRTHPGELRTKLLKLRGSLSSGSFCGMDGVACQRKVRDEWDAKGSTNLRFALCSGEAHW